MNSLAGHNILEISRYPAGSILGMMLADEGAVVSKVMFPDINPQEGSVEFSVWNRGKTILHADIFNNSSDLSSILAMSANADIVIVCLDPQEIEYASLEYASLEGESVVISLPCFPLGHTLDYLPPEEEIAASSSGVYSLNPSGILPIPGEGPSFHGLYYSSSFAAITAASAVIGAILQKNITGLGQQLSVSLHDSMYQGMGTNLVRHAKRSEGRQTSHPAIARVYECKDGKSISINMSHPRFLEPFLKYINKLEWFEDLTNIKKLLNDSNILELYKEKFASIWKDKTAEEWEEKLGEIGVPGSISRTVEEWIQEEQAFLSESIVNVTDLQFGEMKQPGKLIQDI